MPVQRPGWQLPDAGANAPGLSPPAPSATMLPAAFSQPATWAGSAATSISTSAANVIRFRSGRRVPVQAAGVVRATVMIRTRPSTVRAAQIRKVPL